MGKPFERAVTSVKCYFRDDAAVIFKDTSRNYYLLLVLDPKIELKNLGSVKIANFSQSCDEQKVN
jgi:hypothetical protein